MDLGEFCSNFLDLRIVESGRKLLIVNVAEREDSLRTSSLFVVQDMPFRF